MPLTWSDHCLEILPSTPFFFAGDAANHNHGIVCEQWAFPQEYADGYIGDCYNTFRHYGYTCVRVYVGQPCCIHSIGASLIVIFRQYIRLDPQGSQHK